MRVVVASKNAATAAEASRHLEARALCYRYERQVRRPSGWRVNQIAVVGLLLKNVVLDPPLVVLDFNDFRRSIELTEHRTMLTFFVVPKHEAVIHYMRANRSLYLFVHSNSNPDFARMRAWRLSLPNPMRPKVAAFLRADEDGEVTEVDRSVGELSEI